MSNPYRISQTIWLELKVFTVYLRTNILINEETFPPTLTTPKVSQTQASHNSCLFRHKSEKSHLLWPTVTVALCCRKPLSSKSLLKVSTKEQNTWVGMVSSHLMTQLWSPHFHSDLLTFNGQNVILFNQLLQQTAGLLPFSHIESHKNISF